MRANQFSLGKLLLMVAMIGTILGLNDLFRWLQGHILEIEHDTSHHAAIGLGATLAVISLIAIFAWQITRKM